MILAILLWQHLRGGEQVPDGVGRQRGQWRLRAGVQLHGGQLGQFADRRQPEHLLRLLLVQLVVAVDVQLGALDVALRLGQVGRVQLQQHRQRRRSRLAKLRFANVRWRGAAVAGQQFRVGAGDDADVVIAATVQLPAERFGAPCVREYFGPRAAPNAAAAAAAKTNAAE